MTFLNNSLALGKNELQTSSICCIHYSVFKSQLQFVLFLLAVDLFNWFLNPYILLFTFYFALKLS